METLEAGLRAPLFSFPTVTGTEIPASQRQADGRNMPPRPLEKQIRLVDCGTGLDPSCTKHGGGGEGEERKRFRNQDLSDLSHGGESGCRAWGSQVLRMSPFKARGGRSDQGWAAFYWRRGGGCYTGCALTGTQLESGPALTRQLNGRGDADGHEEIRRGIA